VLERLHLGALLGREIGAPSFVIRLDRFAPPLDSLAQNFDDVLVDGIAPQLDLPVLDVGENGTQEKRSGFVLSLTGGSEVGLKAREEGGHLKKLEIAQREFKNNWMRYPGGHPIRRPPRRCM
jgi:hypothetical protein